MCTNFKVKQAADGTVVVGRTMEFPHGMPWQLSVVPVGFAGTSSVPGGRTWTSTYGAVGIGIVKPQWLADGMNTAGLSVHALFMAGHCFYGEPTGTSADITQLELGSYILGTCATLADVRKAVEGANIVGLDPGVGMVLPMHLLVHDKTGSLAIEMRPEGLSVVDNPTGVGTNPPYMDWQLTNLNTYAGISASNPEPVTADGVTITPHGQGAGLRGLPGDYTPPSRFVRAFAHVALGDQPQTAADAEMAALHILNNFDIPLGLVREVMAGKVVDELTEWSTISNLTQGRYAYRTYDDPTVYVIDLSTTDFTNARLVSLPGKGAFTPATV